jgi:hypothetical protein
MLDDLAARVTGLSKIAKRLQLAPLDLRARCVLSKERDMPEATLPTTVAVICSERGRSGCRSCADQVDSNFA